MSVNWSTGSTTYSVTSATSRHTASSMQQETSAKIYFVELQSFLVPVLAKEASEGVPVVRTAARQKLSRLTIFNFTNWQLMSMTNLYEEIAIVIDLTYLVEMNFIQEETKRDKNYPHFQSQDLESCK
ncbi:unnamed protein product [Rhizopus stolonifer]